MTESHSHADGRRKKHKPEKKGKQRAANGNGSKAGSEARSISKRIERRRNEENGIKEQGKGGIENKRLLGEKIETQRWRLPGGGLRPPSLLLPPAAIFTFLASPSLHPGLEPSSTKAHHDLVSLLPPPISPPPPPAHSLLRQRGLLCSPCVGSGFSLVSSRTLSSEKERKKIIRHNYCL